MDRMHPSTITSIALLVARALEGYGLQSTEIFHQVGMDPAYLEEPNARYSYAAITRLWKIAAEVTGEPCFGLVAAGYWHPTTMHALGYAWLASDNLLDGLERLVRYSRIMNDVVQVEIRSSEEMVELIIHPPKEHPPPADEALDAAFALVLHLCRSSYGADFSPVRLRLQRDPPSCRQQFSDLFACPVEFSAAENVMEFRKSDVTRPLGTGNAILVQENEKVVADYLARLDSSGIKAKVRSKLMEMLPAGTANEYKLANTLGLSPRSLQRKLKDEQTSYSELLEETRRQLGKQYLSDSRLSINEITYLLGFSEPASFSRAFKRWTGHSPTEYRNTN
jgi:AraC-like DNA-binding protein